MTEGGWVRHVSFDDLAPSIAEDEAQNARYNGGKNSHFIHVPPQFSPLYGSHHGSNTSSEWSSPTSSFQGFGMWKPSSLKRRLPPAPETSSLKLTEPAIYGIKERRDSARDYDLTSMDLQDERQMKRDTDRNTERNSGSKGGVVQDGSTQFNEPEEGLVSPQRKSFAGMSDEELTKLEDFYNSRSRSTHKPSIDKFDFHEQRSLVWENPPMKNRGVQSALVDPLTPVYPTRPVITHRAISLTTQNSEFLEARRTVTCYISGRRHTWSAADWYVENESKNGDHLVIVTTISNFENQVMEDNASRRNPKLTRSVSATDTWSNTSSSSSSYGSQGPKSLGIQLKEIHERAKATCRNILNYYAFRLNHRVVKITVEMVKEDSCKDTLTKTAALYKPDLQIVSTVSTNLLIKFRNSRVKIPSFMMRHYPIPTCVVPYEFIDPILLHENAGTPLDKAGTSTPVQKPPLPPNKLPNHLKTLDSVITKTLNNPFRDIDDHHDDSDASVTEYFPMPIEQQREMERFEQLGYVRPKPTRPDIPPDWGTFPKDLNGSRRSSRSTSSTSRNPRLHDDNSPIYKVRSLVDGNYHKESSDDGNEVQAGNNSLEEPLSSPPHRHSKKSTRPRLERSKSASTATKSSSTTGSASPIMAKGKNFYKSRTTTSTPSSPSSPANRHNKGEKKQKGALSTFFKKMFGQ